MSNPIEPAQCSVDVDCVKALFCLQVARAHGHLYTQTDANKALQEECDIKVRLFLQHSLCVGLETAVQTPIFV
jgi:hypothetical protein